MIKAQKLQKNDLVDILAPGSASLKAGAEDQIQNAVKFVESWGLRARVSSELYSGHPYLSNTDEFRFQDLKRALFAKDSKAIFSLRGGYGSLRLIPQLLKIKTPPKKAKIFMGYSDITSLNLFLSQKWKWLSLHGPLLDGLSNSKHNQTDTQNLRSLLFGDLRPFEFQGLKTMNAKAEKMKNIEASVTGGNLTVFSSHYGSSLSPKLRNQIIFFEELSERGYRVDRLLAQLEQQKDFSKVKAVVFGEFLGGDEKTGENFVGMALEDFAKRVSVPVFRDLSVGHGAVNWPIFMGAKAKIKRNKLNQIQMSVETGIL